MPPSSTGGLATQVVNYANDPAVTIGSGRPDKFVLATGLGRLSGAMQRTISGGGLQPAATGADYVIALFSIPGELFDGIRDRGVRVRAWGKYGANANNKTVKLIFNVDNKIVGEVVSGGTTVVTTGLVASDNLPFDLSATLFKYGDPGSNSQIAFQNLSMSGAAIIVPTIPALLTAKENDGIRICVTGNAATAVTDILVHGFEVTGFN